MATLQAGEWQIQDIAGAGLSDKLPTTLLFGPDGSLSEHASCNHLIASHTVEGSELTITPASTTMKACSPTLMNQRRKLGDLIGIIARYNIDRTSALNIKSASGKQILARR